MLKLDKLNVSMVATGLTVWLSTQSAIIHAESDMTNQQGQVVAAEPATDDQRTTSRQFVYPRWPEQKRARIERTPPPPPGPYMSTALSGNSVNGFSFDNAAEKRVSPVGSPKTTMESLSPDRPWPSNLRPPQRWQPENGYRYIDSAASKESQLSTRGNEQSYGSYGYRAARDMNAPVGGMRVPYGYAPSNGSAYSQPPSRSPYASQGMQ